MLKRYKFDIILIFFLIALSIVFLIIWLNTIKDNKGRYAHVYRDSEEILVIDLLVDDSYKIEGEISFMTISVKSGYINVDESGCTNQICVHHHAICNIGSSIICIPNKVEIRIDE